MDFGFFAIDGATIVHALNFFLAQGVVVIAIEWFAVMGWLLMIGPIFSQALHFFIELKEEKYVHDWKPVILAIDIPALNVQTPMAVEQLFSHVAGALTPSGLKEKIKDGYVQRWFSFEIVSIEGYIQFVVWTESVFRDLVEASIYAQYPDAEITEIEDYVHLVPEKFPNETHDLWVNDFGLAEHSAYPLRSYREFEHSISKDTVLKDPMGTFLESFTRLGPGEQMWWQILVEPINNDWKEGAINKVKEVLGIAEHDTMENIGDKFVEFLMKSLVLIGDQVFNREASPKEEAEDEHADTVRLTPGTNKIVELMEQKITKLAFKAKMRAVYVARKESFNPRRGASLLLGAINQYNIPSANSIVAVEAPKGKKKDKPAKLFEAYRKRSMNTKSPTCILNIEELATIWHFPMSHVKTPLVSKAATKQAEPPVGLPVEYLGGPDAVTLLNKPLNPSGITKVTSTTKSKNFTTDSGEVIEYDNWYENL